MKEANDLATVIADCYAAIQRDPESCVLQVRLGTYLQQAGNLEGAVEHYRHALTLNAASHAAYNGLGTVFAGLRDWLTAIAFFQAAIRLSPEAAELHNNLANVYFEQGQFRLAVDSYRSAIALRPEAASYYNHLGNALCLEENYAEAEVAIRKALLLRPDYAEAHANLGFLFLEQEKQNDAEVHYREAIRLRPDYALAHICLARILLRRGEFTAGWAEQEWRWQWKDFPSPLRNFSQPQWKGESMGPSRLFLHAEQGFGDTIQFLRYVPLVVDRLAKTGARVLLEVHPELFRLAGALKGVTRLTARGDPIPEFEWHCPLMSLPLAFATTIDTIPCNLPYLLPWGPGADDAPYPWSAADSGKLRVGLVWAGSGINRVDGKRSLPLSALAPLFAIEDVSFFNLQRDAASATVDMSPYPFAGHLPQTGDFADTALCMAQLDLVISVDTSVAHLAGALGKPVWILLPKLADWRWLMDRSDSPWYPSARLFRQKIKGEWESVIDEVALALRYAAVANRN